MLAFWQTIYWLMHLQGQYQTWSGDPACWTHVTYSGSALQAWLLAAQSHGHLFWGQVTGPAGCGS